ncbi:Na+/H+ antiporter NhaA [candidate division KSB1 bacterium]|nr:Na+/H+ antiporter NhaA [candidate division KSB1 bacterium]
MAKSSNKVIAFLFENSLFLIFGAFAGLAWANIDHESYEHLLHLELFANNWIGTLQANGSRIIDLHFLVNDVLMVLFFAIAGKEVWEAALPGGPLSNPRRAAVPIISAVGGMAGPALLYLLGASMLGQYDQLSNGWAIPCATDIAFSYMVARLVFGPGHPAIPFLLLLAIADDAMGLLVLAVFYPQEEVQILWMLLPVAGVILGLIFRRLRLQSFWWYITIPGILSWIGFAKSGIHPALGLLPIIPTMPHAHVDKGLFDWEELNDKDTLNSFEHWFKNPVEIILALFGFLNAGVVFSAIGSPTFLVLGGLLLGKPIGIWLSGMLVAKGLRFGLPDGITPKVLLVIGFAGGIGFTVALFVATVAFEPGAVQDAAKMGALFSFAAAILTYLVAKVIRIEKIDGENGSTAH